MQTSGSEEKSSRLLLSVITVSCESLEIIAAKLSLNALKEIAFKRNQLLDLC